MKEFNIGKEPTNEEWNAYFKVRAYNIRIEVANYLICNDIEASQEIFEVICHRCDKVDDTSWEMMDVIYRDEVREQQHKH